MLQQDIGTSGKHNTRAFSVSHRYHGTQCGCSTKKRIPSSFARCQLLILLLSLLFLLLLFFFFFFLLLLLITIITIIIIIIIVVVVMTLTPLRYLVSLSGALALLNMVPCYSLDGQWALFALADYALSSYIPHEDQRNTLCNIVLTLGTLLLVSNIILALWTLGSL